MDSQRRSCLLGLLAVVLGGLVACRYFRPVQQSEIDTAWGIPETITSAFPHLRALELPRTVTRLDWLKESRLSYLDISQSAVKGRIADLPDTLKVLQAQDLRVTELGTLPQLIELDLRHGDLEIIENLPETLDKLAVGGSSNLTRVTLPQSITTLILEEIDPEILSGIPRTVRDLSIISSQASTWGGELPSGLSKLTVRARSLEDLPDLPAGIESLVLVASELLNLRRGLPPYLTKFETEFIGLRQAKDLLSLQSLHISGAALPDKLPSSLEELSFTFSGSASLKNSITIPALPKLKRLAIIRYPGTVAGIPSNLDELDITATPNVGLEQIPGTLRKLVIAERGSVDLSKLPQSLESLDISYVGEIRNSTTVLPNLKTLVYQGSSSTLPVLNESLEFLDVSAPIDFEDLASISDASAPQPLVEFSSLPSSLTELRIRNSEIDGLAFDKLPNLKILDMCGAKVSKVKSIPLGLTSLRIDVTQLDRQVEFSESLVHLSIQRRKDCRADDEQWKRLLRRQAVLETAE